MKVLVLGSSGIIGSHMQEAVPVGAKATFVTRGNPGPAYCDATDTDWLEALLVALTPDAVVNLAGESNTDRVQADPDAYYAVNVTLPHKLAQLSEILKFRLVHVSSQAVYSGADSPVYCNAQCHPINAYGEQKATADNLVLNCPSATVIRPTFVLGVRRNPAIGRANPIEQMLSGQRKQVNDRWFSPSFAPDVADCIWSAALAQPERRVILAGVPIRTTRYQIARALGVNAEPVSHNDFPGLAPRPVDTSYGVGDYGMTFEQGIQDCLRRWQARQAEAA